MHNGLETSLYMIKTCTGKLEMHAHEQKFIQTTLYSENTIKHSIGLQLETQTHAVSHKHMHP